MSSENSLYREIRNIIFTHMFRNEYNKLEEKISSLEEKIVELERKNSNQ